MWAYRTFAAHALAGLVLAAALVFDGIAFAQTSPAAEPRPRNQLQQVPLQVQQLPPALEQILHNWSQATRQIKELKGEHNRFVYDHVFETETQAKGKFYYRAPDMGRIDLHPYKYAPNQVSQKRNAQGQPFTLVEDKPEKWICDGERLMQVNEQERQVDVYPIPEDSRGTSIMNGPLPFLFGMPPEVAKRRYQLTLVSDDSERCIVEAVPRLQSDAANYKKAAILLEKKTWLPKAVKLYDPAGNKETVFAFENLEQPGEGGFGKNVISLVFPEKDPFFLDPKRYKFVYNTPVAPPQAAPPQSAPPRAAGQDRGEPVVRVAGGQQPAGSATLDESQQRPAAARPVPGRQFALPSFEGLSPDQVKAQIEQHGLKPIYQRGEVAPTQRHLWKVYAQSPPAGTVVSEGAQVKLVYYVDAEPSAPARDR